MWGNKQFHVGHFSSVFRVSQLYTFLVEKKRCLIEQEDKHGLLLVKCSRMMICESYVRVGWTWLTQVASPPQDIAVQTHSAHCVTLLFIDDALWTLCPELCTTSLSARHCRRDAFSFLSFQIECQKPVGNEDKRQFLLCDLKRNTMCKITGVLLPSVDDGWICRSCAPVGGDAGGMIHKCWKTSIECIFFFKKKKKLSMK